MYLYQSLYHAHLTRWFQYFDQTRIFIVFVEELKKDPLGQLSKIYDFLGVDADYRPEMIYQRIHETRLPQNFFFESAIKQSSFILKKVGLANVVNMLKNKGVNRKIYGLNSKEEEVAFPPMKEKTRAVLLNYFTEKNKKLAELLDKDVSCWSK